MFWLTDSPDSCLRSHCRLTWYILEKLIVPQPVKKYAHSYPHSQQPHHLWQSCTTAIQSPPPSYTFKSVLIISFHVLLGLLSGLTTKTLYTPHLSPYVPHAPPIMFILILSPKWLRVKIMQLLFTQFSPVPYSPIPLRPNLFPNNI
jgi:hypothetical protein